MPNLMITTGCNFKCPYCFGREIIGSGHAVVNIDLSLFRKLTDWIQQGCPPELDVHLMGGEPTLHPDFAIMVRELRATSRPVRVFSNASTVLSDAVLEEIVELDARWIVNVNNADTYSEDQFRRLNRHLSILGSQAMLTFNVTGRNIPSAFLFDLINQHRLSPKIKLGVALPTMNHCNVFVKKEAFTEVASGIMGLFAESRERGIRIEFECGVPYCLFNAEQRNELEGIIISHCGSRLDITPDGEVINCLPLAKMVQVPYWRFEHYGKAVGWFRKVLEPYHSLGCSTECLGCPHLLKGKCHACLAYGMNSYNRLVLPSLPHEN